MNPQKIAEPENVTTKDGRVFAWLAEVPYTRLDGTKTGLNVWHSPCAVCGAPVFAQVAVGAALEKSKAFGVKHCDAHKLSPAEACRRGRAAQRAKRKAAKRAEGNAA